MRVAIIPSSHASTRLPGKNILPVNGKPMMAYPIEAALKSGLFDQIIVSTADQDTAEIAKELGCKVFPSPPALQSRDSTVVKVCQNVLTVLNEVQDIHPEYFCCIYAWLYGIPKWLILSTLIFLILVIFSSAKMRLNYMGPYKKYS